MTRDERWLAVCKEMQTSITAIIRTLCTATALSALLAIVFLLIGRSEIATPFVLATAIGFGMIVISIVWRALVRAHPGSR